MRSSSYNDCSCDASIRCNKVIILDNGHGQETPGKRSPDGLFREYKWCRDFVQRLKKYLQYYGYTVIDIVPGNEDIGLSERANMANKVCDTYGVDNCIFISVHNNAAGNGKDWYNVTGWECYTSPGNTGSDKLATILYEEADLECIKTRTDYSDGDPDKESGFTVIMKTKCPAVITENMFMDSHKDIEFLQSEYGIQKLLNVHLNGVRRYFEDPDGDHYSWVNKLNKEIANNYEC